MYGDSLLVAPVVARGATSRSVYLPDAAYYDYWSGARVTGAGDVTAQASLDVIPVYARIGAIIPMLSSAVETVVPAPNGSVISAATLAGYLGVDVFAGGQTSVQLDDGTVLSQSAPVDPFTPTTPRDAAGPMPMITDPSQLSACGACAYVDPTDGTWSFAVQTSGDTITAGPLTLAISSAPSVKRFVLRVRH
jgi:hypothetical protein